MNMEASTWVLKCLLIWSYSSMNFEHSSSKQFDSSIKRMHFLDMEKFVFSIYFLPLFESFMISYPSLFNRTSKANTFSILPFSPIWAPKSEIFSHLSDVTEILLNLSSSMTFRQGIINNERLYNIYNTNIVYHYLLIS